ncbi:MAG: TIGR02117 family protein [Sphingomonadaceae bacterium]
MTRNVPRQLLRGLLVLLALPALYLVAALAGALVPVNGGWHEPEDGVLIYIGTNGVHTDLIMPARAAGHDWHGLAPPGHVARPGGDWVSIGWGQRQFYLETRTWDDLDLGTAVEAVFGGPALLRVAHLAEPGAGPETRPLRLSDTQYRRLAAAVADYFVTGEEGGAIPLPGTGYGEHDLFYESRGRYDAIMTCNQWTALMLRRAGIESSLWAPFAQGLMWRYR